LTIYSANNARAEMKLQRKVCPTQWMKRIKGIYNCIITIWQIGFERPIYELDKPLSCESIIWSTKPKCNTTVQTQMYNTKSSVTKFDTQVWYQCTWQNLQYQIQVPGYIIKNVQYQMYSTTSQYQNQISSSSIKVHHQV
jgi:hypothetical protein